MPSPQADILITDGTQDSWDLISRLMEAGFNLEIIPADKYWKESYSSMPILISRKDGIFVGISDITIYLWKQGYGRSN